jgi:NAD(P)-dependent dehydrogenase (short-subunit alcohol dehydrogenase family)
MPTCMATPRSSSSADEVLRDTREPVTMPDQSGPSAALAEANLVTLVACMAHLAGDTARVTTGARSGLSGEEQEARMASFAQRVRMDRAGTVDDVANAILFLSSDEVVYITGRELGVDGGYLVR